MQMVMVCYILVHESNGVGGIVMSEQYICTMIKQVSLVIGKVILHVIIWK